MQEWQFDGLVGPTHNYAGLSYGNVASSANAGGVSNPREAALQGLEKMRFVQGLGISQCFLPPQKRPLIPILQQIGFEGGTNAVLDEAARTAPALLASVYSSSYMWAANAGTIAPSCDTADGKLHITPANLLTNFHRSLEAKITKYTWDQLFADPAHFVVHDPLPATPRFSDEGAANHMRASATGHATPGLHIFVYGTDGQANGAPRKFPARQHRAAYEAIARMHRLPAERTIFVQQSPEAIDAGVFHNDVIAMNTTRLMIAHEHAFAPGTGLAEQLRRQLEPQGVDWHYVEIGEAELPMADAVKSYFFNSQVLELPDGRIVIVAPSESEENPRARDAFARLAAGNAVAAVHYRDVRESMRNGGGPACLRLRVVLSEAQAKAMHQGVILTDARYQQLKAWIERHYRDRLSFDDLRDPAFIRELDEAYAALEPIIGLPGFYQNMG
ncbi:MAG: succinylarginine dihydrolase [Azospirillum brasilense]|nr:MAG: succinylarginine dihydrolase [Azospirillum brasilense]